MRSRYREFGAVGILAACCLAMPVGAAVIDATATATADVHEVVQGVAGPGDAAELTFPENTLPLQVIARHVIPEETAAGLIAAQFSDPNTALTDDTDQFAIDLALSSVASDASHQARGAAEEARQILYSVGELGSQAEGETVPLRGRLFLDGALAIFAETDVVDLTGVRVSFHVTVEKEAAGATETVFDGALELTGGPNRQVNTTVTGDFPRLGIFNADLTGVDPDLAVFRAAVFPGLVVNYNYDAVVGQPLTLRAKVGVDAANVPGGSGVAAVIGTPVEALQDVISRTRGSATAQKMTTALTQERQSPTGTPLATAQTSNTAPCPCLSACGLVGFEAVAGLVALVGWRTTSHPVRRARRR